MLLVAFFSLAALAASPSSPVTVGQLIAQGDELEKAEKHAEAREKYNEALKREPAHYEALMSMADTYMSEKNYAEAKKRYEAASAAHIDIPGAWKGRAKSATLAKDYAGALAVADAYEKYDATSCEPHRMRGDVAVAQGDDKKAYVQFQKAVAADPRRGDRLSLAAAAVTLGKKDEAIALIRDVVSTGPWAYDRIKKDARFAALAAEPAFLAIQVPAPAAGIGPKEGQVAPEFSLPKLSLSNLPDAPVASKDLRGKVALVNFWATWCPPCRKEFPSLQKFYESVKSDPNVAFCAISEDGRGREWVKGYLEKNGYSVPVLLDPAGTVGAAYEASGIPTTVLLRPDGTVAKRYSGDVDFQSPEFQADWKAAAAHAPAAALPVGK